jgi:hypothetical protein
MFQLLIYSLISTTKFAIGAAFFLASDIPALVAYILACGSATIGVYFYVYLGLWLSNFFAKFRKPKIFKINKRMRWLVSIKKSSGLLGVAALTPLILSIPLGCFLSLAITTAKWKVITYQLISIWVWGIILFSAKLFFGYDITDILP